MKFRLSVKASLLILGLILSILAVVLITFSIHSRPLMNDIQVSNTKAVMDVLEHQSSEEGCEPSKVFANERTKVFANGLEKAVEFPGVFDLENSGRFRPKRPAKIMS